MLGFDSLAALGESPVALVVVTRDTKRVAAAAASPNRGAITIGTLTKPYVACHRNAVLRGYPE